MWLYYEKNLIKKSIIGPGVVTPEGEVLKMDDSSELSEWVEGWAFLVLLESVFEWGPHWERGVTLGEAAFLSQSSSEAALPAEGCLPAALPTAGGNKSLIPGETAAQHSIYHKYELNQCTTGWLRTCSGDNSNAFGSTIQYT